MRFATVLVDGVRRHGAVTDDGFIDLTEANPDWPSLFDVIQAGGLAELSAQARDRAVTHTDVRYDMILPDARRILCVGVNFPDRNAEFRGGRNPMTPEEHRRAAADLLAAERSGKQIGLLSLQHPDMTMDDAYAIQSAILEAKLAQGRQIIGWKIGLTSKAMQMALGIDIPDSGILFDDMRFDSGATVPAGRFIAPRVEAEIAFVMRDARSGEDVTRDDVLAATDYVCPSLEILDTRILRRDPATGGARKIFDTISDNAANAGVVLGPERHDPAACDLRWTGAIVTRDGTVEETGLGAGVLNDPVASVVWLARRMAQYGQRIEAGQIILSGSFIRPIECPPGTRIDADFGSFGQVEIAFA